LAAVLASCFRVPPLYGSRDDNRVRSATRLIRVFPTESTSELRTGALCPRAASCMKGVSRHTSEPTAQPLRCERGRSASARPVTNAGWGSTEERGRRRSADDGRNFISHSSAHFAERFERGKLSFTGDVYRCDPSSAVSKVW